MANITDAVREKYGAVAASGLSTDHAGVRASLAGVGLDSAQDLLGLYAGRLADLHDWLGAAEINRDRNLRLQYLAGEARNSREGRATYGEMLALRRPPAAPAR